MVGFSLRKEIGDCLEKVLLKETAFIYFPMKQNQDITKFSHT